MNSLRTALSDDGVFTITLARAPVNALDLGLLDALAAALAAAPEHRALVIAAEGSAFSAGLDLPALLGLDEQAVRQCITRFAQVMETLFAWPRPTVAALNGHAVAGGFVLAATADLRVAAAGKATFGMTGVSLGIAYPSLVTGLLQYVLPNTAWHAVLLEGELMSVEQAQHIGFIRAAVSPEALAAAAHAHALRLMLADPAAYARTKATLKAATLSHARAEAEASREAFVSVVFSAATRRRLEEAVKRLQSRRSPA